MGLAGLDERHARRVFGNIQEAHARDAGLGAPVVLEAHEIDPLTALPVAELERAGADRVGGEVLAELRNDVRVDDGRRGVGEVREEGREGRREPELDGVLVDRDDLFDAVQEEREGEREVRVGEPLHAPHDDLGRQRSAVVEHDVVAQRDGPSEAVGRQLGARRQERHDLALGRQLVERLVHVAHDGRGRRVGRVVWVEGDCVGALGDDERPLGGRPSDQTNDGERDDELAALHANVGQKTLVASHGDHVALADVAMVVHLETEECKDVLHVGADLEERNGRVEAQSGDEEPQIPVKQPQGNHTTTHHGRYGNDHVEEVEEGRAPVRGVRIAPSLIIVVLLVVPGIVVRRAVRDLAAQQSPKYDT